MQLKDIIDKCRHLRIYENRCATDDFIELVFHNEDLSEWYGNVSGLLGEPRKAEGREPTEKDLKLTARTGGIRFEQTLFEKEFERGTVIAKFWPWKDNQHTTLRMALLLK